MSKHLLRLNNFSYTETWIITKNFQFRQVYHPLLGLNYSEEEPGDWPAGLYRKKHRKGGWVLVETLPERFARCPTEKEQKPWNGKLMSIRQNYHTMKLQMEARYVQSLY